jgi:hypothetical protein
MIWKTRAPFAAREQAILIAENGSAGAEQRRMDDAEVRPLSDPSRCLCPASFQTALAFLEAALHYHWPLPYP